MSALPDGSTGDRVSEVLARLALVNDPELDESVTALGFVTGVTVDAAGRVGVGFRLPTYWCAANFAFLMADDMRREIADLLWVTGIDIELGEHMYAETINRAVATGLSFKDTFAEEADGNLDEVRQVFAMKAFQRRQMALLDHLGRLGYEVETLLGMSIAELMAIEFASEGRALVSRYLERRNAPGAFGPGDRAFVDETGGAVAVEAYGAHRRALRRVTVNVEFNGALCRGLLAARYGEADHTLSGEPTLLDFVRDHRPKAAAAPA
ncbi:iron-sulfur cluster assembly protein [Lichenicoccus sp.]|uniref:iron-sulfur cluster assembly protein n=1 Tax=Lichenicoccus sp. TaxID=2781899 RepID=UPI003D11B629